MSILVKEIDIENNLTKIKSRCFFVIDSIVILATSPATNLAKIVANSSYSLLEYLHGMQGVSGSSPLGSIRIFASYTN